MLYIEKEDAKEKSFVSLLEKTKINAVNEMMSGFKPKDGLEFQDFVFDRMCIEARGTDFDGAVRQSGPHSFPDILARKYFGVEVKLALSDKWTSLGNSVLESTRAQDVRKIYMLFGRVGKKTDIKYRLYQDCLKDISVTHSPRYLIDMELPDGESIFSKLGVDYDALRKDGNPISKIKDFYRSQLKDGEELWWIDQSSERVTSPIIKPFRSLSESEKMHFLIEAMILFPEIFGPSSTKFERATAYLMTRYNSVSASLRDLFTAGGKEFVEIDGRSISIPQIYGKLYKNAPAIVDYIQNMEPALLSYYWRVEKIRSNRLGQWQEMLDLKGISVLAGLTPSHIFNSGIEFSKNSSKPGLVRRKGFVGIFEHFGLR